MKKLHVLALLVALLALAACSGDDAGSTTTAVPTEPAIITVADLAYSGATSASVGQTVTVANEDTVDHTWTAVDGDFDSGTIAAGATFDHIFTEPGEFDFFCTVHPTMTGTITVEA